MRASWGAHHGRSSRPGGEAAILNCPLHAHLGGGNSRRGEAFDGPSLEKFERCALPSPQSIGIEARPQQGSQHSKRPQEGSPAHEMWAPSASRSGGYRAGEAKARGREAPKGSVWAGVMVISWAFFFCSNRRYRPSAFDRRLADRSDPFIIIRVVACPWCVND